MPQHRTFLVLVVFVAVLSMTSCGSSRPATSPNKAQNATEHAEPARATPSAAAKMVCAREAQTGLAAAIGVRTTQPIVPTWSDHIYSCRYTYNKAVMVLSVKELSNKAETDAYFTSLKHRLGTGHRLAAWRWSCGHQSALGIRLSAYAEFGLDHEDEHVAHGDAHRELAECGELGCEYRPAGLPPVLGLGGGWRAGGTARVVTGDSRRDRCRSMGVVVPARAS